MNDKDFTTKKVRQITWLMTHIQGPLFAGDVLFHTLGYGSGAAMRKAHSRGTVPVTLMELHHRKLRFALSDEIAGWLIEQRLKNSNTPLDIPINYGETPSDELKLFIIEHGYLVHEAQLIKLTKVVDKAALLKAKESGMIPFPMFCIDNRQTKLFALGVEVFISS